MNIATAVKPAPSARDHSRYILKRVADCFLRENYRGIAAGRVAPAGDEPFIGMVDGVERYLVYEASDTSRLLIPVEPDGFMQEWRVCQPPFVHIAKQGMRWIDSVTEFLEIIGIGLEGEDSANIAAFLDECQAAIVQGTLCDAARGEKSSAEARLEKHPAWHRAMLATIRRFDVRWWCDAFLDRLAQSEAEETGTPWLRL